MFITVEIRPENADEFLLLVSDVIDRMREETTFISTVLSRDRGRANRFSLFEVWADREDFFEVQLQRGYRAAYHARIDAISVSARQISEWDQIRADYAGMADPLDQCPAVSLTNS